MENNDTFKNYFLTAGLVFLLAFIPRIVYMFVFSDPQAPGWYTDTFHHWQVAYLSKEIGFSHGFLRLWDFKGMEFFWGLLHPLVLVILFILTGSISILIPKLLTVVSGSVGILFLFLLIRRYFNLQAAWAVALFAAFFPLTLFSNTVGMQEEFGFMLILGGILLWPKNPVATGILLGLGSMIRSEYWLFSAGLVIAVLVLRKNMDKAVLLVVTYTVMTLVYMKYLANWTGNYIYPIYWNFLASAKGEWFADLPIVGEKLLAKQISQGIFAFGIIGGLFTLYKRPKHALLFLFGFANITFVGFMVGFGAYVKGYIPRFWVDRLYNWPYLFTAILLILGLFYLIPKKLPLFNKLKLNWLLLISLLVLSQLIWKPINYFMRPMEYVYAEEKQVAADIAKAYKGGTVLLPEDRPIVTYYLAHDFQVPGKNMEGQMFDPFFYFENKEDPFLNWGKDRKTVLNWLKKDDIRLIVLTVPKPTYLELIKREPSLFENVFSNHGIILYKVLVDKIN